MAPSPVTRTVVPVCVQVAFQPPSMRCHAVGQPNVSVQPAIGVAVLFVMSMEATYPLPQSLVLMNRTVQLDAAGLVVVKVSGCDGREAPPAASRARTLTVYRRPG